MYHKYWNWNCDRKTTPKQKSRSRWLHISILLNVVKNLPANAGYEVSVSRLERSPGEGNGNTFQYSCLGIPMDRGAWLATAHKVANVRHDWAAKHSTSPYNMPYYLFVCLYSLSVPLLYIVSCRRSGIFGSLVCSNHQEQFLEHSEHSIIIYHINCKVWQWL